MGKQRRPSRDEIVVRATELKSADEKKRDAARKMSEGVDETFREAVLDDFLRQYGTRFDLKGAKAELRYVNGDGPRPKVDVRLTWPGGDTSATFTARVQLGAESLAARKARDDFGDARDALTKRINGPFALYRVEAKADLLKKG